jgi:hypothetical protein
VSLAGLADADGIPEMDQLIVVGPLLFVSITAREPEQWLPAHRQLARAR